MKEAWDPYIKGGMEAHRVHQRLNCTARAFRECNRSIFGLAHERSKGLKKDVKGLRLDNNGNLEHIFRIEEELRTQQSRQENIARHKSNELWLAKGNENTKFFHSSIINRRRRKKIHMVFNGEIWLRNPEEITRYFLDNFT